MKGPTTTSRIALGVLLCSAACVSSILLFHSTVLVRPPASPELATTPRETEEDKLKSADESVKVFIGIKTSDKGEHGVRLPQIQKTWLKDALRMGIDIKFFTNASFSSDLQSFIINPPCGETMEFLTCKMGAMFSYFLEHNATWFCNFDDDNYVLVHNLLKVLTSYQQGPTKGHNVYVGRQSVPGGVFMRGHNTTVHFLTGGAGYCLSRDLVERGRQHFTNMGRNPHSGDDGAVGYIVQEKLGVTLIENHLFHSHYDRDLRRTLPKDQTSKQVSFGVNNKKYKILRYNPLRSLPDIPIRFSSEDDPLFFRSLRCFLLQQESGVDVPECQNTTASSNKTAPAQTEVISKAQTMPAFVRSTDN